MGVARIKSEWIGGNLVFKGADGYYVRFGYTDLPVQVKVHTRPTTLGSALEIRSKPSSATAEHAAIDALLEPDPTGDTATAGYGRAVQGVTRTLASHAMTAGTLVGLYGQFCNLGTLNGGAVFATAMYGLIEDGGTYTAVSHLAAQWLDSHLTKTVTAGHTEFLYITNNGSTDFDQAIYIYGGDHIGKLLALDTVQGMVDDADNAGGSTLDFTNWKKIKIEIDGEDYYIVAAKTVADT